jgi:hypothetical protein
MTLLVVGAIEASISLAAVLCDAWSCYPGAYHNHAGGPQLFLWVFPLASQLALSSGLLILTAIIVRELYPGQAKLGARRSPSK